MDNIQNKTIGVIGYGHFGKVICRYLFPDNAITLYTSKKTIPNLPNTISIIHSFEELASRSDIIIPAVPIRKFETVIKQLVSFIKSTHIIIDVSSVKEYPISVMKKLLPDTIQIITTHPMFGPVSLKKNKDSLIGLKIVTANINVNTKFYEDLTRYFRDLGLTIITMSPEEHDKLAAQSHFFSKAIRYLANELDLHHTTIDTPAAKTIFDAFSKTANDKEIIEDMIVYNRYCKKILESMIQTLTSLRGGTTKQSRK